MQKVNLLDPHMNKNEIYQKYLMTLNHNEYLHRVKSFSLRNVSASIGINYKFLVTFSVRFGFMAYQPL